ncbi:hypothetical protein RZE82_07105 [Mollicutes bacterium LVI A0039]|nr:hypothetical protein RZE82_07105 [Mollicutes bacterium LVI A0039]
MLKIAIMAGNYYFTIVPVEMVKHVNLKKTNTTVEVDEEQYIIFKGETFEDSQKVDFIMDSEEEFELNKFRVIS